MGANDESEWFKREIDWLDTPLAENKPFLGICLGAQMLAAALGARVFTHEDKRSEIGYFPIRPTAAGDRLCVEKFPRCVYQWHSDGFDLPGGAELLAAGAGDFPNQAYRYGRCAVGLQFHPEVTYHMMCRSTLRGAERLTRPGAQQRPRHLDGWFQHDGHVAAWLEAFLPAWLEQRLGQARAAPRPLAAVVAPKPEPIPQPASVSLAELAPSTKPRRCSKRLAIGWRRLRRRAPGMSSATRSGCWSRAMSRSRSGGRTARPRAEARHCRSGHLERGRLLCDARHRGLSRRVAKHP